TGSSHGLFFKSDGTKMYLLNSSTVDRIIEYALSTAWDVSTASFSDVFDVSPQDTDVKGIYFKPDGLTFYITGSTNDRVFQYTLGTAWDLTTASYASLSFSISTQTTTPIDLFFKSDGTKMFVIESANEIFEYTLSTAWNVSTSSYVRTNVTSTGMGGIFIRDNGESFFFIYSSEITVYIT